MSRFQKILIVVLSGLLLAVVIVGALIVQRLNADADQRAFLQCMEIRGYTPGQNDSLQGALDAANECDR